MLYSLRVESAVEIVSSLTRSKEAPFFFSALGFLALFLEGFFFFFNLLVSVLCALLLMAISKR